MGGTQSTIGVGRPIRLTLDKVLPVKVEFDIVRGAIELHHHVLDLTGLAVTNTRGCHGLEPVAVSVGSTIYSPVVMVDNWFEGGIEISEAEEDCCWDGDEMYRKYH